MLPSAMLEGKNDLIQTVENVGHVRVCVFVGFVFDAPLTEISLEYRQVERHTN
jgi:hypothetical protein